MGNHSSIYYCSRKQSSYISRHGASEEKKHDTQDRRICKEKNAATMLNQALILSPLSVVATLGGPHVVLFKSCDML